LEEAQNVITSIKSFLEMRNHPEIEGEISLDKMVVIARNRFIFKTLETELEKDNIPYSLRKGERCEEPTSVFGKVLDYAIRLKLNPKDWVDGKKLCYLLKIDPPNQWENGEILKFFQANIDKSKVDFSKILSQLLQMIDDLNQESPNIRKFVCQFKSEFKELAVTIDNDEKRKLEIALSIDELDEFRKCWTRFRKKGLGDSLQAFRNAMALGQLSDDVVENGLTLSTVHTMKGLEKDIVFLIGMCEGVFPDYRAHSKKEINEERNNAFVAITRAKRWLFISYPKQRLMPWGDVRFQQQSRFLKEIADAT
jgi:DNA helicase-2/ATP-dependent DNA helicase PcrA